MKVLIYLEEDKLLPKGGPYAVGYYYKKEFIKHGDNRFEFLLTDRKKVQRETKYKKIVSYLPDWINSIQRTIRTIRSIKRLLEGEPIKSNIDFSKFDIIHFHDTRSLFLERENLSSYKGIVILQSHSPIPLGQELCKDMISVIKWVVPNIDGKYEIMDKYAFNRADYIIFPCERAIEPYCQSWKYFDVNKEDYKRKFKYVLTGIDPCFAKSDRNAILKKYEIEYSSFVISYVGRHNTVKGYDILKAIAKRFFERNGSAYVIAAGLEEPFKRLSHPRWKEVGFTNDAYSLIAASDVFVLPNRVTYFDIVMLEILSLGKIVIASRTGGNKLFEDQGLKGVLLYDTIEEAVDLLDFVYNLSTEQKRELELTNMNFYSQHLQTEAMYNNYCSVIDEITSPILREKVYESRRKVK